ncbi:hypothetical protein HY091_00725 [Candidatus Kaiserbacteria bacterium]|nr:hypothetical protein [Candidatus Kaiserbacteria bacterium]
MSWIQAWCLDEKSCILKGENAVGYKPTLGGLKKAQEFLNFKGYPMPIFQMNIYADGQLAGLRWAPGRGRTVSIDEAIRKYGATCEMVDVRLTNARNDKFVQFSDAVHCGIFTCMSARENGWDVILEFHKGDPVDYEFKDFMDLNGDAFVKLARWGKAAPSMLDRIKFRFFSKRYAAEMFV